MEVCLSAERTTKSMIATIDRYFDAVDARDIEATLAVMTVDCTLSVLTDSITHQGRDTGIRQMFERRLQTVKTASHENRRHIVDPVTGIATTRFEVRRTSTNGEKRTMDNINFFEFQGDRLCRISIWMSGENPLR